MSPTASAFETRGPYAVGVLETTIACPNDPLDPERRLPSEVWYPSEASVPQQYDAPHPLAMPHLAAVGLSPLRSPCGLIAFSHGNSGFRQQSTFLTTHLASWGFVVVAPDHVGNTFFEMLGLEGEEARKQVHRRARAQRPHDLVAAMRALLDNGQLASQLPPLDSARLGTLGHSFGGWTSLKTPALERRVRSICSLAPVAEPFVGRKAFGADELPIREAVETLILAAREDTLVDLDTSILPLVERLGPKTKFEIITGADHFHFCDGLERLHKMHENARRPNQKKPTQPFARLQGERAMHAWLTERVTRFFHTTLGGVIE